MKRLQLSPTCSLPIETMTSPNGLICFTNCLLPLEDGSLVERDLWIDEGRGTILDAQASAAFAILQMF